MPSQWYYHKNGQQQGPFSWEEVYHKAEASAFGPTDLVWAEGMENWTRADQIRGLFSNDPPPASLQAPESTAAPSGYQVRGSKVYSAGPSRNKGKGGLVALIVILVMLVLGGGIVAFNLIFSNGKGIGTSRLAAEKRHKAIEEVMDFVESLPFEDFDAETKEIVAFLQSHSAFEAAGANETGDTIWAIFNDGTLYFIVESNFLPSDETLARQDFSADHLLFSSLSGMAVAPNEAMIKQDGITGTLLSTSAASNPAQGANIPASNEYLILRGMGNYFDYHRIFEREGINHIPEIQSMLEGGGYIGREEEPLEASLETLRSLDINNVGVLYFWTHGGNADVGVGQQAERRGALWTTTEANFFLEMGLLAEDLAAHRVGKLSMLDRRHFWEHKARPTHYAITDLFIDHYWGTFSDDSLVYLDACSAVTYDPIVESLAGRNASVVFGWNRVVTAGVQANTSRFIFDRLLGANQFRPENPPQRAFDFRAVFAQHIGPGSGYGYCSRHGATLEFRPADGSFGILAPSIERMLIDEENEQLHIYGIFGEDKFDPNHRQVTVEGEPLAVNDWAGDLIIMDGFSPDKEGVIVVEVDKRKSNAVPITSWRNWEIRYIQTWYTGPWGELISEYTLHLDLRGDVHPYRERPGGEPIEPQISFIQVTNNSLGTYRHHGTKESESEIEVLSGDGDLSWYSAESGNGYMELPPESFRAFGTINMEESRMLLNPVRTGAEGTSTRTSKRTGSTAEMSQPFGMGGLWSLNGYLIEVLLEEYSIVKGQRETDPQDPYYVEWMITKYEWERADARHAPDDELRR